MSVPRKDIDTIFEHVLTKRIRQFSQVSNFIMPIENLS